LDHFFFFAAFPPPDDEGAAALALACGRGKKLADGFQRHPVDMWVIQAQETGFGHESSREWYTESFPKVLNTIQQRNKAHHFVLKPRTMRSGGNGNASKFEYI
jgi:hypothetical protein